MSSAVPWGNSWHRRGYPILAGALVGLVTGVLGLVVTSALYASPWGGMVGAAGCGVTAVYLSGDELPEWLLNAVVADIVSSVVFFLLVLVGYLGYIWITEGLSALGATLFAGVFVALLGLGVAVPVGVISLTLTIGSAAITAFLT